MQNSDLQKYLKENPLLEDKNSNSEDFLDLLSEGLTEDESKAVLDKYKKRYAAVLKSNPDFIKKYPNPDKVIYGMVMNEVKRLREKLKSLPEETKATEKLMDDWGDKLQLLSTIDSKDEFLDLLKGVISIVAKTSPEFIKSSRFIAAMGDLYNQRKDLQGSSPEQEINEKLDATIKEVFSEKQRKYMCVMAQPGAKRPKGLSKADAKEMCADTNISKAKQEESQIDENMEDKLKIVYDKVVELIKKELESGKNKNKNRDLRFILSAIQNKKTQNLSTDRQKILYKLMRQAKSGNMNENRLNELVKSALMGPVKESNAYIMAADKARDAGKKEFEFPKGSGKMHPVKIKADIDEAEVNEIKMMDFATIAQKVKNSKEFIKAIVDQLGKQSPEEEKALTSMYHSLKDLPNPLEEDKVKGSNIKKVGDKYRVLSGKTGKMWKQKYDSKEDAEAALRGYFASQNESLSERILKELRK